MLHPPLSYLFFSQTLAIFMLEFLIISMSYIFSHIYYLCFFYLTVGLIKLSFCVCVDYFCVFVLVATFLHLISMKFLLITDILSYNIVLFLKEESVKILRLGREHLIYLEEFLIFLLLLLLS